MAQGPASGGLSRPHVHCSVEQCTLSLDPCYYTVIEGTQQ